MEQSGPRNNGGRTGRDHLVERSRLKRRIGQLQPVASILIVEDTAFDAEVLSSALRLVVGQEVAIVHARTLREVSQAIVASSPDLIFLDDRLGPNATAEISLKLIRSAGYKRPVIVISGLLTRLRCIELAKLGVADVVHKDETNTVRLAEAILKVLDASAVTGLIATAGKKPV